MAWAEAFGEKQAGISDLIGQVQQKRQAEEAERGHTGIGILKLLGGAVLMAFGNPVGTTLIGSGLGDLG